MSQTTQHLREEHAQARRFLRAFLQFLKQIAEDTALDSRDALGVMEFLSESALLRHEEKEESLLLPELARMRETMVPEALQKIRAEHSVGRELLEEMRGEMFRGSDWGPGERARFAAAGTRWVEFLLRHMLAEETYFFPVVDELLSADIDALLVRDFQRVDEEFDQMADACILRTSGDAFIRRYT